jgi:hypothetical protein
VKLPYKTQDDIELLATIAIAGVLQNAVLLAGDFAITRITNAELRATLGQKPPKRNRTMFMGKWWTVTD